MRLSLDSKNKYGFLSEQNKLFPPMVIAEITNMCNLRCIHCPYTFISKNRNYKPRHMSWEIFTKIVEEASLYNNVIFRLLSDGEPLMHPRFLDMIHLAKEKGIAPVNFITNGMLLDEKMAKGILAAGVEVVEISLDALYKQTYEKIRKGADYDLVMFNTHKLIELRNILKAPTKIMVSIIEQPEAMLEIDDFVKYWTLKADKVIRRRFTSIGGLIRTENSTTKDSEKRWPCPQLWRRFFINVDGYAEFCVEDWHDKTIIGDLSKATIKDIWTSSEYERIRGLHKQRRFSEIAYCSKCQDWQARNWDYDYFWALDELLKTNNS